MSIPLKSMCCTQASLKLLFSIVPSVLAACSAGDEVGRIGSPSNADYPNPANSISAGPPSASSSAPLGPAEPPFPKPPTYVGEWPPPASEWWKFKLSPVDQAIANTCPHQVWSKNVPDQDCSNDSECGDGFCDRGHCGAIETCSRGFGQRCELDKHCYGLCIDGRCRSCISNVECEKKGGHTDYVCSSPRTQTGERMCAHLGLKARRPQQSPP